MLGKVPRSRSAKRNTPWPDELLDFLFASTVWICSSREWSTGPQRVAGCCYMYLKGSFHNCLLTDSTARFVLDSLFAMLRFASVLIWFARPGSDRRCGELLDCAIYIYFYIYIYIYIYKTVTYKVVSRLPPRRVAVSAPCSRCSASHQVLFGSLGPGVTDVAQLFECTRLPLI